MFEIIKRSNFVSLSFTGVKLNKNGQKGKILQYYEIMGSGTTIEAVRLESWCTGVVWADAGLVLDWTSSKFSMTKPVRGPALYLTTIGSPLTSGIV